MKTINHLMSVIFLGIMFGFCSCTENSQATTPQDSNRFYSALSFSNRVVESAQDEEVYICTGPNSKRYHRSSNCMGLSSCSADIRCVTISYAKELGRTPCKRCY